MSHHKKTISQSDQGYLTFCSDCNLYHLTFQNIQFEFSEKQYRDFKKSLLGIEKWFWSQNNTYSNQARKILLPTKQKNLTLKFNRIEIESLILLVFENSVSRSRILNLIEIDYPLNLN